MKRLQGPGDRPDGRHRTSERRHGARACHRRRCATTTPRARPARPARRAGTASIRPRISSGVSTTLDEVSRKITELTSIKDVLETLADRCGGNDEPECAILDDLVDESNGLTEAFGLQRASQWTPEDRA